MYLSKYSSLLCSMQVLYPRISPKKECTTYVLKFGAEFFIGSQTFCASLNDI